MIGLVLLVPNRLYSLFLQKWTRRACWSNPNSNRSQDTAVAVIPPQKQATAVHHLDNQRRKKKLEAIGENLTGRKGICDLC